MSEERVLYSTLLLVVALISAAITAVIWRRRRSLGGWALVIFCLAMTCWSGTYALFWADLYPHGFFWLDATYLGAVAAPPAFFVFVLQFTHREQWFSRPVRTLLILQPVITTLVLWTDPWHALFYGGLRSATASTIYSGGPWFWANFIYLYLLSLLCVILLVKSLIAAHGLYHRQIGVVLLAALLPWIFNILSLIGLSPLPALDLTPIAFTLTGVLLAISLLQYRFLDVIPVARSTLIDNMEDGILVVDSQDRVVDANHAVVSLLGATPESLIGRDVTKVLPSWAEFQGMLATQDSAEQEIPFAGAMPLVLDVRLIALQEKGQVHEHASLVILRDITQRKRLEMEREELIGSLQDALVQVKALKGLLPICSSCKKIRDDQGYWQDVAVYIRDHSEAEFSHGLCPDCLKALYPEYADDES